MKRLLLNVCVSTEYYPNANHVGNVFHIISANKESLIGILKIQPLYSLCLIMTLFLKLNTFRDKNFKVMRNGLLEERTVGHFIESLMQWFFVSFCISMPSMFWVYPPLGPISQTKDKKVSLLLEAYPSKLLIG